MGKNHIFSLGLGGDLWFVYFKPDLKSKMHMLTMIMNVPEMASYSLCSALLLNSARSTPWASSFLQGWLCLTGLGVTLVRALVKSNALYRE